MGGEAPADAPHIECPPDTSDGAISLTVAVYQADARIAHAIIPLAEVWQVWPCIHFRLLSLHHFNASYLQRYYHTCMHTSF
jgi:hypothetical protein